MILVCFVRAFLYKRKKRLLSVDNKRFSNCELSHEDSNLDRQNQKL